MKISKMLVDVLHATLPYFTLISPLTHYHIPNSHSIVSFLIHIVSLHRDFSVAAKSSQESFHFLEKVFKCNHEKSSSALDEVEQRRTFPVSIFKLRVFTPQIPVRC